MVTVEAGLSPSIRLYEVLKPLIARPSFCGRGKTAQHSGLSHSMIPYSGGGKSHSTQALKCADFAEFFGIFEIHVIICSL